ncbi:MAG: (d)CMP kinase [Ruminococcaceae bacterium]|nr:(d)CMP kinase [Oscillospiraceae bacterium]
MISVAIDGPAGAGKSTVARKVAAKKGYIYVDTGALYRTVAYSAYINGVSFDDNEKIVAHLDGINVDIAYRGDEQRVLLNGEDVSDSIRTPIMSEGASKVSAIPEVRAFLLGLQRKLAAEHNVVMDGRDIATVVLPDATVKIFLTASAELRARRRYDELIAKGQTVEYEDIYNDLLKRDHRDSTREVAPLKPAEDSVLVDTSELNFEEAVNAVCIVIDKTVG